MERGDSIMDEPGGLRLKRRLRCGPGSRLLEWHPRTSSREEREKRDARERRDPKFDVRVRSSENLELRTSNLRSSRLSRAAHIPIDQ